MNEITKLALMQYIFNLEEMPGKNWIQYILMDAAYITLNGAQYPYKGTLSKRLVFFAADMMCEFRKGK